MRCQRYVPDASTVDGNVNGRELCDSPLNSLVDRSLVGDIDDLTTDFEVGIQRLDLATDGFESTLVDIEETESGNAVVGKFKCCGSSNSSIRCRSPAIPSRRSSIST